MYDPKNAKETAMLPPDAVLDGVITQIKDGKVKEFVQNTENWKGSPDQNAIDVVVEIMVRDKPIEIRQIFTYNEEMGTTQYAPRSNLAIFKKKYGELPRIGLQVKISTNGEGFGRLKLV